MLGAERPPALGDQRLEDRDRLRHAYCLSVRERLAVPGMRCGGMLGAEDPLGDRCGVPRER